MYNKTLHILLAAILFTASVSAQEFLVPAGQNPVDLNFKKNFKSGILLELPFIDDFSDSKIYPDQERWADNHAFINNNYPVDQPSYGVATLDAIDSLGRVYPEAGIRPFRADFLTSNPINLNIGGDTTVYLSFYYQAQGHGDAPEPGDSLVLEFYSPSLEKWNWAWSTPGTFLNDFELVLINVKGAAYLQEGFRFRFVSYASLAESYEPSLKTNADQWHLDYVYLNKGRSYQDVVMPDLALINPVGSLLLDYTAMPWGHYKTLGINAVKTLFPIHIRNLSGERYFYTPNFKIEDIYGIGSGYDISLQPEEITSYQKLIYEGPFNYGFESEGADTASFKITLDLQPTENDMIPGNTKLESVQEFGSFYAYDDGSAEAGYGMVGEGANTGRVAIRFENLVSGDSLIGADIYFNRSFDDANHKYFNLAIWNEIDGKPGELLYRMNSLRADLSVGLTEFNSFKLDSAQIVPSVFYIGWLQVTSDFLNVGFDRNNINNEKIFYTKTGVWEQSKYEGSLMIRPVFANKSKKTGIAEFSSPFLAEEIKVYPNPASTFINLDYPQNWENSTLSLLDIYGRTVYTDNKIERQISLPSVDTGTYFLVIRNKEGKTFNKKILITNE